MVLSPLTVFLPDPGTFKIIKFSIMIKTISGAKRNRLKGVKLISPERMRRYSLIVL
jgi:hypothetical protein